MAYELPRSQLKLTDHLAGGPYRKIASEALTALTAMTPGEVCALFTDHEFERLGDVPPEAEWFANIDNPQTQRADRNDWRDFMAFVGTQAAGEFREVVPRIPVRGERGAGDPFDFSATSDGACDEHWRGSRRIGARK